MMMHADVNLDGSVTAADAITVINNLDSDDPPAFVDTNRDGRLSALDALYVINRIEPLRSARRLWITVDDAALNTLTNLSRAETIWAVYRAFDWFESLVDYQLDLKLGTGSGGWVRLQFGLPIIGGQLYRGIWQPGVITIWRGIESMNGLANILVHEIAAHQLGLHHSSDPNCITHSNAGVFDWCPAEAGRVKQKLGF